MESSCDLDKFLKLLMMESQVANEESEQQQQQDQNQQLQNEQQELRQRDISEKLLKNAKQDHWILQHDGLTLKPRLQQDNIATYAIQSQMPLVKLEPPETPPTPETPPSPDTKSVLKATIQRRRRATGQGDFENLFTEKEPCQLTEEDVMKRERRRQQNRVSARTFRTKKKLLQENAKKQIVDAMALNKQLQDEIAELRQELNLIKDKMAEHHKSGCCLLVLHTNPDTTADVTDPVPRDTSCDALLHVVHAGNAVFPDSLSVNGFPQGRKSTESHKPKCPDTEALSLPMQLPDRPNIPDVGEKKPNPRPAPLPTSEHASLSCPSPAKRVCVKGSQIVPSMSPDQVSPVSPCAFFPPHDNSSAYLVNSCDVTIQVSETPTPSMTTPSNPSSNNGDIPNSRATGHGTNFPQRLCEEADNIRSTCPKLLPSWDLQNLTPMDLPELSKDFMSNSQLPQQGNHSNLLDSSVNTNPVTGNNANNYANSNTKAARGPGPTQLVNRSQTSCSASSPRARYNQNIGLLSSQTSAQIRDPSTLFSPVRSMSKEMVMETQSTGPDHAALVATDYASSLWSEEFQCVSPNQVQPIQTQPYSSNNYSSSSSSSNNSSYNNSSSSDNYHRNNINFSQSSSNCNVQNEHITFDQYFSSMNTNINNNNNNSKYNKNNKNTNTNENHSSMNAITDSSNFNIFEYLKNGM